MEINNLKIVKQDLDKEKLSIKNEKIKKEYESFKKEVSKLQFKMSDYRNQNRDLEEKNLNLQEQNEKSERDYYFFDEMVNSLKQTIEEKKQDLKHLKLDIESYQRFFDNKKNKEEKIFEKYEVCKEIIRKFSETVDEQDHSLRVQFQEAINDFDFMKAKKLQFEILCLQFNESSLQEYLIINGLISQVDSLEKLLLESGDTLKKFDDLQTNFLSYTTNLNFKKYYNIVSLKVAVKLKSFKRARQLCLKLADESVSEEKKNLLESANKDKTLIRAIRIFLEDYLKKCSIPKISEIIFDVSCSILEVEDKNVNTKKSF